MDNETRDGLNALKNEAWDLARRCIEQGETQISRTLVDFIERLATSGIRDLNHNNPVDVGTQRESDPGPLEIFVRYKGERYEAEYDAKRLNGGRGRCVYFKSEWLTASLAARLITHTQVNGWRFWKYLRTDGTAGAIEELR